jgi:Xaa-Pro aminopeptidase
MMDIHARRRRRFLEHLGPKKVALISGRSMSQRNSDVEHRFRQTSDLLYLTGFGEPDTMAVFRSSSDKPFVLFVRPRDPERETWTGRRHGIEGAVERFGADEAFPFAMLQQKLPELLDGAEEVLYLPGDYPPLDELVMKSLVALRAGERRGQHAPPVIRDLRTTLHELRLVKDEAALESLRRAVEITRDAHMSAMRSARHGVHEYEIEALIDYTFRRHNGHPGYGTIVGGGVNATILHYVDNYDALKTGELLLIDAGCEIDGFTADVTRTFPIGARFSGAQRAAYELVLEVEKRCIEMARPGATIEGIHQLAVEGLTRGMVDLKLLSGSVDGLIESGAYRRFYMHRTSHWLGLDVHDVGTYSIDGRPRPLAPGMVFTIEPGLYISPDASDVPEALRGIGIRIEDDLLVTESGHEVLTAAIPKEVADVEAITAA